MMNLENAFRGPWKAALATALAMALLEGCVGTLRFGPEGEISDPAVILQRLDERAAKCVTVQSDARVKVRSPEQSGTVDAFFSGKLPGTLRLGVLDFFGRPVADVLALDDHFQVHDAGNAVVYIGEPSAENLARILFVPVSPADAVQLLFGTVRKPDDARVSMTLDRDSGTYRVTLTSPSRQEETTLFVETENLHLVRVEARGTGGGYNVEYGDFQRVSDVDIPFSAKLDVLDPSGGDAGVGLQISQRDVTLNGRLPSRTFEPILPRNARIVNLDGGAPRRLAIPIKKDAEPSPDAAAVK